MKNIISDSIWAHMFMFFFYIILALLLYATKSISPIVFVGAGSVYVLLIIHSAIRIADFEMSELGKVVNKAENGAYKEIHIIGVYKNESN